MSTQTPKAEVDITLDLVRDLLAEQFPDFANLPIQYLDSGWDNAMFRPGDHYVIRLPRRKVGAALFRHESTWLPKLSQRLPLPTSAVLHLGAPCDSYPWHWGILPWFDGTTAGKESPDANQAGIFGQFLTALHQPAPVDAPVNTLRGIPITTRKEDTEARLKRLESQGDWITADIYHHWKQALAAPTHRQAVWIHGDLHPKNILVEQGKIAAIVDWGDITSGDPATDLASVWMLFDTEEARETFFQQYPADDALMARAQGWAVFFASVLLENGLAGPEEHRNIGERTFRNLTSS